MFIWAEIIKKNLNIERNKESFENLQKNLNFRFVSFR
jgi:hypothetical protein